MNEELRMKNTETKLKPATRAEIISSFFPLPSAFPA
jgi:hypothetical protein